MAVEILASETEDEAAIKLLEDGLTAFNAPFAGALGYTPLSLMVRRAGEATPCGGLIGFSMYRWFFVRLLFLPEDLRGGGTGRRLLAQAEAWARARGCIGMHLDTFSFQARPFYEKQGYTLFGTLEGQPQGGRRHFLMKRLEEDAHVPT